MPLYFFDVADGDVFPDSVGLTLPDLKAAQLHAIGLAETILREQKKTGHAHKWYVTILDRERETLATVTSTIVDVLGSSNTAGVRNDTDKSST